VEIQVDKDQIVHVFAENDEDLYFAQGWIVASQRLWEMEFLARVASGRLSEIVGERGIEVDKMFVKLGIPEAAKESAQIMVQDPVTGPALKAYAAGANAWIKSLRPQDLPFEYKLLGHKPEPWDAARGAFLLKFMA